MHICFSTRLTEHLGIQLLAALCERAGHRVSHVFEPGLSSAGLLPAGWSPEFFDTDAITVQEILATGADVVGFNVEINTFSWTVDIAQRLKAQRPDLRIIVGGVHATTVPEVVMEFPCFDALCVGEGDEAILEYLAALDEGRPTEGTPNFHVRTKDGVVRNEVRPLKRDLDDLPFFDKRIHYNVVPEMSYEYHTNASRGCVYSCSFCFYQPIQRTYGGRFRNMRSPEHTCREVKEARARWPAMRTVTFHDEVFTANRGWLKRFADLWPREVGLPFSCITHPELVTEETAHHLARAGCAHVIMGTQTVNDRSRKQILDRTESNEDVRRAVLALKAHGLWVVVDHILGIPGESDQDQDDALLFYSQIRPDVVKAFFLTYLPGTDINKHGLESGAWTLDKLKQAERGHIDSWLFKGVGDIPEWRSYYQLFTLFTSIPPEWMAFLVRSGLHRQMKKTDGHFLPSLFLVPRVLQSLVGGREEQPRSYLWYIKGLFRYALQKKYPDQRALRMAYDAAFPMEAAMAAARV